MGTPAAALLSTSYKNTNLGAALLALEDPPQPLSLLCPGI